MSRSGDCAGYSWNIGWTSKPGDQPLMGVVGDDLVGPEVEVTVDTLVDGGTWIRPLRGDMLRTPESEPQVSRGPYSDFVLFILGSYIPAKHKVH